MKRVWLARSVRGAGFLEHRHQTFRADATVIADGVIEPFFVGCHSSARVGDILASERSSVTLAALQKGQPFPRFTRGCIRASHSCSGFVEHLHQTFRALPGVTLAGVRSPFFVGCHSAASFGNSAASEFAASAYCPAQNGQPFPRLARFPTVHSHSCEGLARQSHHTFLDEPS